MTGNNLRTRPFVRLILGAGALVVFFRLFSGHIIPQSSDVSGVWDRVGDISPHKDWSDWGASEPYVPKEHANLTCAELPGANDTVVIMKTGATEFASKFPIHLDTTMRCYPNTMIYADFEEDFYGHHVTDAFVDITPDVKAGNPDFVMYRRLHRLGRKGLKKSELKGPEVKLSEGLGKPDNPGWKVDKWKFLPMVNMTLFEYPGKDWYIFLETDTFIFWSTTLAWLNTLNASEPHYLGSQMQIRDDVFAHGGSGFVLSQGAMRAMVELFRIEQRKWEGFVQEHWSGDCILGRLMDAVGAPLTWSWPIFQGNKPGAIHYSHYDYSKRLWCYPTISYHHMAPVEVESLWNFEQKWLEEHDNDTFIRHKDVYNQYILPRIEEFGSEKEMHDWSNICDDKRDAKSLKDCRIVCEEDPMCIQYSWIDSKCKTDTLPKMGEAKKGAKSGWFVDRAKVFGERMRDCDDELWIESPKVKKEDKGR